MGPSVVVGVVVRSGSLVASGELGQAACMELLLVGEGCWSLSIL